MDYVDVFHCGRLERKVGSKNKCDQVPLFGPFYHVTSSLNIISHLRLSHTHTRTQPSEMCLRQLSRTEHYLTLFSDNFHYRIYQTIF